MVLIDITGKNRYNKHICMFKWMKVMDIGNDSMSQVRKTLNGFFLGIGIYGGIIEIIGLCFFPDKISYTLGLLFGIFIAVVMMLHITKTLGRALSMPEQQAVKYTRKQAVLRLGMMLLALIVGLILDCLNFVTVIIGMLGLKIGAFLAAGLLKRMYPEEFVTKSEEQEE